MNHLNRRFMVLAPLAAAASSLWPTAASAQKKYDIGVTDTEIKTRSGPTTPS